MSSPQFARATDVARLATCHPDLVRVITEAAKTFPLGVIYGQRTVEEQQALFAIGRTIETHRRPVTNLDGVRRKSKHNASPSLAVDIWPAEALRKGANPDSPAMVKRFDQLGAHVKAVAAQLGVKITWGGDWKMRDRPHFEL